MITRPARGRRRAALLAAAALAAIPGPGAADGWSVRIKPGWSLSESVLTDELGREVETESDLFLQEYRLTLDKTLMPLLVLSAGGFLDWNTGTQRVGPVASEVDAKRWNGYASLKAGGPFLSGALDYNRREEVAESIAAGATVRSPHLVRDAYSASLTWRPSELPSVDLRLGRIDTRDRSRLVYDQTSDDASLALRWAPARPVSLRYSVQWAESEDRRVGVESSSLVNGFSASWGDTFRGGRIRTYLNYNGSTRSSWFAARGPEGYLDRQQFTAPGGGLSKVEGPLDTPERVTLAPNAALVDGDVLASAGLNLGYSASAAGDVARRDLGGTFPNVITPVNRIHVSLDRPIEDAAVLEEFLTGLSTFTVWQSEDNLDWTAVDLATGEPVLFDPFLNRFEIPLAAEVQARHLKVVTRPLRTAITTDPRYAEIFVTEVQFFQRIDAEDVPSTDFTFAHNLNGTARVTLVEGLGLTYDFSMFLSDDSETDRVTYSFVNGLSLSRRLGRVWLVAARAERTDADAGVGHEALNRWSASLSASPLPTLGGSIHYSGQLVQRAAGTSISNSAGVYARAELYQGVSLGGGVTASLAEDEVGLATRSTSASGSATFEPNRVLSFTGSVAYTSTAQSGGGRPDRSEDSGVVDATLSLSPFPALALGATLSRYFAVARPATLASFNGSFSPFPGGALQLRYGYQETLDTGAEARTRTHGPGVRWNIRTGWYVDAAGSFAYSDTPSQTVETRSVFANLLITLR